MAQKGQVRRPLMKDDIYEPRQWSSTCLYLRNANGVDYETYIDLRRPLTIRLKQIGRHNLLFGSNREPKNWNIPRR